MTVTGKTLAENVADAQPYAPYPSGQDLVRPFEDPIKKDSHLRILYGNLASEGAVAKSTGKEGLTFSGTALVYESEETALRGILDGEVKAGNVVVIRNVGPVGGPGMREMLSPTSAIMVRGLVLYVALIKMVDFGRKPWICGRACSGSCGGRINWIIDQWGPYHHRCRKNLLTLDLPEDEIARRQEA